MRVVSAAFVSIVLACVLFFAGSQASAQEVVASYGDSVGSIIKYRASYGLQLSRIQQVYRVGGTVYHATKIAVADSSFYYVVFGDRYLAKLRASDGAILWAIDAGAKVGITTYFVSDLAVVGDSIFLSNQNPGGRIAKYRVADGGLVWSVQRAVQEGVVLHVPLKLAAVGNDSFLALLGSRYLSKMRQSDGAVLWQANIAVSTGVTTWGVGDLTVSGGFAYVSNLDPNGTIRKFSVSGSCVMIWSVMRTYRTGMTNQLPTRLAAVGNDPVMVLFGYRYLARMNPNDGQILWVKDIGLTVGATTFFATDIAAVGFP